MSDIDWMQLLRDDVAARGSVTATAMRLGFTRGYVSQVINGLKNPVPQTFVRRVIDRLHVVPECPVSGMPQPRSECARIYHGPAPTHNPLAMRFWKTCQTCPHRPSEPEKHHEN